MDYSVYSSYYEPEIDAAATAAFAIFGIFGLIMIVIGLICYVFCSLGLMRIAKAKGIENAWLAWIPFANLYILGKVVGPFNFVKYIQKPEVVLPVSLAISLVVGWIPLIGTVITLAAVILLYVAYYFLYKQYFPEKATTMIVLSIFFSIIVVPIYLMKIAKIAATQGSTTTDYTNTDNTTF